MQPADRPHRRQARQQDWQPVSVVVVYAEKDLEALHNSALHPEPPAGAGAFQRTCGSQGSELCALCAGPRNASVLH